MSGAFTVWQDFAQEVSGEIIASSQVGSPRAWSSAPYLLKVRAPLHCSSVTFFGLHTLSPAYGSADGVPVPLPKQESFTLTAVVPFVRSNAFRFAALPAEKQKGFKVFGDRRVGSLYPDLEQLFSFETNDLRSLSELFANESLRSLLSEQAGARFRIQQKTLWSTIPAINSLPGNLSVLMFNHEREICTLEQLKQVNALVSRTFTRLMDLGLALDSDPGHMSDGFLF